MASATLDGTKATVTYTTTGDPTQVSYVITDATWDDTSGWKFAEGKTGPEVLVYGALDEDGSFTLPNGYAEKWDAGYNVYVLAEAVSEGNATDYASAPVEVEKPAASHTVKVTTDGNGTASADPTSAKQNTKVKLSAKANDGYEFSEWQVVSGGVTVSNNEFTMPDADVEVKAIFKKKDAPKPDPEPTGKPTVSYSGHVQTYGDKAEVKDGATLDTTGEGKRLEALKVTVSGGSISYRAHVQGIGWQEWKKDGAEAGTHAQAKRMEAVQMTLDDALSKDYSVWYRVHSQTFGWLGWAKDGEPAGTTGLAKRVEAIEVQVLPKGAVPDGYDASVAACRTK